ncbi:MAG TPA: hypothetical protein V6C76_12065 [Drouetiella sp.]
MTMKGLETEKTSNAKSESTLPQFNVAQLMEDFRNLPGKHNGNHGAAQTESLNDQAKKSDAHNHKGSAQLDFGTIGELYGDHNTHAAHGHARNDYFDIPKHKGDPDIIHQATAAESKEVRQLLKPNETIDNVMSPKDFHGLMEEYKKAWKQRVHYVQNIEDCGDASLCHTGH